MSIEPTKLSDIYWLKKPKRDLSYSCSAFCVPDITVREHAKIFKEHGRAGSNLIFRERDLNFLTTRSYLDHLSSIVKPRPQY